MKDPGILVGAGMYRGSSAAVASGRTVQSFPTVSVGSGRRQLLIRKLVRWIGVGIAIPIVDVPWIGISATAPLVGWLVCEAWDQVFSSDRRRGQWCLALAAAMFVGHVISAFANGPWTENGYWGVDTILGLVRFAFWLVVLVFVFEVTQSGVVQSDLTRGLAVSVTVLAGLRAFEAIALGRVGAWANTGLLTQNAYGILFSTFTPFLFPGMILGRAARRLGSIAAFVLILYACGVNGSRTSWLCMGAGLCCFLGIAVVARPGRAVGVLVSVGVAGLAILSIFAASETARESLMSRIQTFESLETDKSFMFRRALNTKAQYLIRRHAIVGVGPGRFGATYAPVQMPQVLSGRSDFALMRKSSHNSYLCLLAEKGVVGSAPFFVLLVGLLASGAVASVRACRLGQWWAGAVYCSLVTMSIHLWSLSGLEGTHAWFVYGINAAMIQWELRFRRVSPGRRARIEMQPRVERRITP